LAINGHWAKSWKSKADPAGQNMHEKMGRNKYFGEKKGERMTIESCATSRHAIIEK